MKRILNSIISVDALDKWFAALLGVIKSQKVPGGPGELNRAWAVCRAEYPRLYEAAFGSVTPPESEGELDEADARAALQTVADVANRVKQISGLDFRFGWKFVADELPTLFNRQFVTRGSRSQESVAIQKKAALLFERLCNREKFRWGLSSSQALDKVSGREPLLRDLASARISPETAFLQDPDLRQRIERA